MISTVSKKHNWFHLYIIYIIIIIITGGCGDGGSGSVTSGGGTETATLSWDAPTTNTDGTDLTDLAGYKIHYGTSPGTYDSVIDVAKVTTYTVSDLTPAAYYFVVTAYDEEGNESDYSNEVSKTIP